MTLSSWYRYLFKYINIMIKKRTIKIIAFIFIIAIIILGKLDYDYVNDSRRVITATLIDKYKTTDKHDRVEYNLSFKSNEGKIIPEYNVSPERFYKYNIGDKEKRTITDISPYLEPFTNLIATFISLIIFYCFYIKIKKSDDAAHEIKRKLNI